MSWLLHISTMLILWSCGDEIQVGAAGEEPRLITDALIRVDASSPMTWFKIILPE